MGKALVIVESPAKAKTINKYLGNNYVVKSSLGHIRDLPKSGGSSSQSNTNSGNKVKKVKKNEHELLINRMGVDPYHGWEAKYNILSGKEKVVAELRSLASVAEQIYLATDLDREGEAIAWHLREVIGGNNQRFSRVVFNEITKNAIKQAFDNPRKLNIDRVNAQQTRRFLDRVVGYMVSPLLWKKIARGLSAGRVQSVAVRMIVERERKIKAFVPQEYWQLHTDLLTVDAAVIRMEVTHEKGKPFKPVTKAQIDAAVALLKNAYYQVSDREDRTTISNPSAPFITSTLQQAASTLLGFSFKKTMLMAQRLYEAGYITYMRTDSTNLSQDALNMARNYIDHNFGKKYLPKQANVYTNQKSSQEAHEAIRPSNIDVDFNVLKDMEADAKKLYQLIWNQFVACQITPAEFNSITLTVKGEDFNLKAKGRILLFDGWTKVMPAFYNGDEGKILSMVKVGSQLELNKFFPSQHFTKPPARFSESSLVRELEKRGIGRPSTYPVIISTIQDRGYVKIENRRFYAEKIGEIVTDRLEENFSELMDYDFTARMEDQLDLIADARIEWKSVLDEFFTAFTKQLESANKIPEEGGMRLNPMVLTSIECPDCHGQMGIRTASTGVFLGCSSYSLPVKECCKKTINLIPSDELSNIMVGEEEDIETKALIARLRCSKCGTAMDSYLIDNKYKLNVCGNNPVCNGYDIEEGEFSIKGYDGPVIECEKCGSEMHIKMGRFGKYIGCTNEVCKNTRKILKSGEVSKPKEDPIPLPELICEKSDTYFVLRDGAAGIFLAANTFPKSRETRVALVEELVRFKDRLPAKFIYLTQAPLVDPEGNKTIVRFSSNTKQQYVSSEKNSKATGWCVFYIDGKWLEKNK
ncbi:DNA topoisomerase 1 [Arsenophonus endosymbiont of Aleurodicus dispersus]|uniref:type I DNA topoisomerase n=1 Tax=Arsenophonus endosymbiont of Aleurodicus dispersus TaxID=235559 RepID=UPI000EAD1A80|nr:type I DNA topoisomerase [Arsenophonus endosymbiont of Aleurodicus dispersus]VAY02437.1 DNA topoisomerase 1 [Arsenophonus endosymbiont of Aleurodicus dispersus]